MLNPDAKPDIDYAQFVKGMVQVKADPELSELVPMDVPNRFMLLSLLIDSPINEDQAKLIKDKMEGPVVFGVG